MLKIANKENNSKEIQEIYQVKNILKKISFFNENFEINDYIGSGAESKVYSIYNKKSKKHLALKYIINNSKYKKNKNELKISSKLKNKNIIDFKCCLNSKEDNSEFIILENAKYGNLRDFQKKILKKECFSESFLCLFSYQILNGLYHCHQNKIVHMDIKPQNIVIDEYLNPKIIDFSVSLDYSNKKPNDKIQLPFRGTNFYMPSEVINSKEIEYKNLNKVDAYALGVLLFKMAYGYYPFNLQYGDENNYKIINQKINCEYEIKKNKNLSSYFIDFISKLLNKDINKRMNIYEALRHQWIKGAQILLEEKEKIYNTNLFYIQLITDNIKEFNDYLGK